MGTCRAATDDPVDRQEVEQAHHRFVALGDIGDGLGLQRVQRPQQCHRQRQGNRGLAEAVAEPRQQECAADNAEQGQSGKYMDYQVCAVKGPRVQPAHGIVQGEREIHDRPGSRPHGTLRAHEKHVPKRPQAADRRIVDDVAVVIEDEGAAKAVRIGGQHRRDEHQVGEPR